MSPRTLAVLSIVATLMGCYKWTATESPISGVKVSKPSSENTEAGTFFTFTGSIVANNPRLITFGIKPNFQSFETYQSQDFQAFQRNQKTDLLDGASSFVDSLFVPANTLPGRYLLFSQAQDAKGRVSDTNRVWKYIVKNNVFPHISVLSGPAKTEASTQISVGARVRLITSLKDTTGLDSVNISLCRILDGGQSCTLVKSSALSGTTILDTTLVSFPTSAIASERYRIKITARNSLGNQYTWQPLYQIQ